MPERPPHTARDVDWESPVFAVGGQAYSRSDILTAATLRGDWTRLEERTHAGLSCVKRARNTVAPDIDLEAAADEFRYAKNLITVEEVEQWLARSAITFDEWRDYLERASLTRLWINELEAIVEQYPATDEEVRSCIYPEAVCSGDLGRFAERLAARACLVDGSSDAPINAGVPIGDRLAHMETLFHQRLRAAITPDRLGVQLQTHRLEWIRVGWRYITFPELDAAREARLCIQEDGETLEEVAMRARTSVIPDAGLLERFEPPLRDALLSATPGHLVGPITLPDGHRLGVVDSKVPPSLDDPTVRRRAEDVVADVVLADRMKQVRWHERL
jgi:hypothetical protein